MLELLVVSPASLFQQSLPLHRASICCSLCCSYFFFFFPLVQRNVREFGIDFFRDMAGFQS